MQIRDNVTAKEESAGRGENNAGSHERALNTVANEGSRNFRRNSVRGQGRRRRGNGNTNSSARGNNNNGVTRRRTRTGTHMIIATQVEQAVDAAEAAATKLEEEEDVVEMT